MADQDACGEGVNPLEVIVGNGRSPLEVKLEAIGDGWNHWRPGSKGEERNMENSI